MQTYDPCELYNNALPQCKSLPAILFLFMLKTQVAVAILVIAFAHASKAVNFTQCLSNINSITIDGKTDNYGHLVPPSTSTATAITYGLCVSQCGAGQEPFQWNVFSQQFSSWLLPWLALVSQLPFGSNDKLDNLESMLLTLGSPTLAAYSLALTALNGRWITDLFTGYRYPNVQEAVRILSSLQQSPLRIDTASARLASLIVLPQNRHFWTTLLEELNYTHTWSISAASSIIWVIIAYLFTIIDDFSQGAQATLEDNGGSVGSLWLWLLPVVLGWLQISPKCDSIRLGTAVHTANSLAYVATQDSSPREADSISEEHAFSLHFAKDDKLRIDERSTAPIHNYARFLPWVNAVLVVSDMFRNASDRNSLREPVTQGTKWQDPRSGNGSATADDVKRYCQRRFDHGESVRHRPTWKWGLVLSRMLKASALALMLQWGTTGAAVMIVWFTPTIGLGCRSASYVAYAGVSTLVWAILLISSILAYYSTAHSTPNEGDSLRPTRSRIAGSISIFLRRLGKVVGMLNALWIVAMGIMQFSGIYDRCYCNSSVFFLGKNAYNVITLTQDDAQRMRAAWIGGFVLGAMPTIIFAGVISLLIVDPSLPNH
ncbi:hypothetical protein GALMADRAFT_137430 [Galerina marginata CBS 339.88]|uniref:Uncharacterized protein n=1 Tax=Galerina marginata (strain CBS 339.88) TaxID=685588 RepID=A0A067T913_GALM3|nr:hypothetical protein GALMADRAFT_137430 [Galerina marginata CBS 339.88]